MDIDVHPADLKQLADSIIASAKALGTGGILKAVDCEDSANPNGKGVLYQDTITVRFRSSAFKHSIKVIIRIAGTASRRDDRTNVPVISA